LTTIQESEHPLTRILPAQGILNYKGENTLAVALWGLDAEGAKLDGLSLKFTAQIQGGIGEIQNAPLTPWSKRPNAV
jgi:hypothetical protein